MNKFALTTGISVLSLLISIFTSCSFRPTSNISAKEIEDFSFSLPDSLPCVLSGKFLGSVSIAQKEYVQVMYYDTLSCTVCEIANSFPIETLYNYSREFSNYELVVIFAPKSGEIELIKDVLQEKNLNYKAYIDSTFIFEARNTAVISNNKSHFCLLNKERKPIAFGNPLSSDVAWNKYIDIITSSPIPIK